MTPAVVIRPIWCVAPSVNQRLPSGPAAIPRGPLKAVGIVNSVTAPAVVIRPILLVLPPLNSTNQRLSSGPNAKPKEPLIEGMGNSVMTPLGVTRAILPPLSSANQTLPSGPATIPRGSLIGVGIGNSAMTWHWATLARFPPRRTRISAARVLPRGEELSRLELSSLFEPGAHLQPSPLGPPRQLGPKRRKPRQVISTRLNAHHPGAVQALCSSIQRHQGPVGPITDRALPVS